jgi:MvdD pre-ATP grasp domain
MRRPDLVVIGTSIDSHIDAVLAALPRSVVVCRLDVDRFPTARSLTLTPCDDRRVVFRDEAATWLLDACPVAWFRRLGQPGLDPRVRGSQRSFALEETEQTLAGALDLINPQRWVNAYWPARRAAIKPWQYHVIGSLGIPFPPTVVSNDASTVREWAAGQQLLYKTLSSPLLEPDAETRQFVFTSPAGEADLRDDSAIALTPCQFQVPVAPQYELRITTIGRRHIAVRIDHDPWDATEPSDWRAHPGRLSHSTYDLPGFVVDQLDALMAALDLQYGASDWIVNTDGTHTILEVNPHGAWRWLEDVLPHLGITAAIAAELRATL